MVSALFSGRGAKNMCAIRRMEANILNIYKCPSKQSITLCICKPKTINCFKTFVLFFSHWRWLRNDSAGPVWAVWICQRTTREPVRRNDTELNIRRVDPEKMAHSGKIFLLFSEKAQVLKCIWGPPPGGTSSGVPEGTWGHKVDLLWMMLALGERKQVVILPQRSPLFARQWQTETDMRCSQQQHPGTRKSNRGMFLSFSSKSARHHTSCHCHYWHSSAALAANAVW